MVRAFGTCGTAAAAGILYQGFRRRSRQNRRADSQACVSVTVGATTVQMTGLVDTGNQLTEPLTGRAVSILRLAGRKVADSRVGDGAGDVPDSISLDRKERMDESSDCGSDGDGIRGKDRRDRASGARSQCSDT